MCGQCGNTATFSSDTAKTFGGGSAAKAPRRRPTSRAIDTPVGPWYRRTDGRAHQTGRCAVTTCRCRWPEQAMPMNRLRVEVSPSSSSQPFSAQKVDFFGADFSLPSTRGAPIVSCAFLGGAPIAQLDRALVYGTKGCRFNSCWARHSFPPQSSRIPRGPNDFRPSRCLISFLRHSAPKGAMTTQNERKVDLFRLWNWTPHLGLAGIGMQPRHNENGQIVATVV